MHIRRDNSRSVFYGDRRKRPLWRRIFWIVMAIAVAAFLIYTQFDQISGMAMNAIGMAPTPTPRPGDLASEAMDLYVQGDMPAAMAMLDEAIAQRPDNIDYRYQYGLMLVEAERFNEAMQLGDELIVLDGFDPRGHTLKSRAMVWSGDATGAIPVALSGLDLDRQFAPLYSVLARAYVLIGNIPAGLEHGELAIEYDPLSADARRSYAYALNTAAAYDAAIEQLEIGMATDPNNVQIYLELAGLYLWRDRDDEAIDLYNRILSLQPRNARAMLRLCDAYRKIGRFEEALGHCENAVRTDPTYTTAQLRLGMIQYSDREFEMARRAFQACVDADPGILDCFYRLGLSHFYLALENPDERRENCDSAWEILQESLLMAQNRGEDAALEDIRLGLAEVSRACELYRGRSPELEAQLTPIPTSDVGDA